MTADSSPPAGAGLPAGLAPPVKVALARAVTKMPRNGAEVVPHEAYQACPKRPFSEHFGGQVIGAVLGLILQPP